MTPQPNSRSCAGMNMSIRHALSPGALSINAALALLLAAASAVNGAIAYFYL